MSTIVGQGSGYDAERSAVPAGRAQTRIKALRALWVRAVSGETPEARLAARGSLEPFVQPRIVAMLRAGAPREEVEKLMSFEAILDATRQKIADIEEEAASASLSAARPPPRLPRQRPLRDPMTFAYAAPILKRYARPRRGHRIPLTRDNLRKRLKSPKPSDPLYTLRRGGPFNRDGRLDGDEVRRLAGQAAVQATEREREGDRLRRDLVKKSKPE